MPPDAFDALTRLRASGAIPQPQRQVVVYSGSDSHARNAGDLLSWKDVSEYRWAE